MTSIFNFSSTSSSNINGDSSLLSQLKLPTTFIIQPPSSSLLNPTTLLTKRSKPAELGDILMKKIKTQSSNYSDSNSQQSPLLKETFEDAVYESSEGLECRSMIEEPRSPSTKSYNEDSKTNQQKMIEELLMPQRSLSTPLMSSFNISGKDKNNQRQLQNALETLQKRLLLEQQAAIIKNILQRARLAQEPLAIPPLQATAECSISSIKHLNEIERPVFKAAEGEPEIFVGEIEYPLLSMVPGGLSNQNKFGFPSMNNVAVPKRGKKALAKMSMESSPESDNRLGDSLFESLAATRAETQRSDSDESEEYGRVTERKRKGKKAPVEKAKKNQKKEKEEKEKKSTKKQQKKEEPLASLGNGRKLTERQKNKLQREADKSLFANEEIPSN